MNLMKSTIVFLFFFFLQTPHGFAEETKLLEIGERPANHVWDRDNLYRNDPIALAEVAEILTNLEAEIGMELYLVTYSSLIGEKPDSFSARCHEQWLGEKNDGLVVVLSFNERTSGVIGRSVKLYEGQFIESQPPYHPMKAPPNTSLKKQIPSSRGIHS